VKKFLALSAAFLLVACGQDKEPTQIADPTPEASPDAVVTPAGEDDQAQQHARQNQVDRFADIQVLRYEVPGFDGLSLQEKKLTYYLSQAALSGRDIIYDQNYEHNLRIRRLLSAVVESYAGDRNSPDYASLLQALYAARTSRVS
jgi:dipeptidyl-peptidase-3